jgi:FemAB family protein
MIMTDEQLNNIIGTMGLAVCQRADRKYLWDETLNRTSYKPVAYSNSSLDYQLAYQHGHGGSWRDISLIIHWNNKPIALWPLSFSIKGEQAMLTSHGLPVLPPIFIADCPAISRKRITKACLDLANAISVAAKLNTWASGESFINLLGMSDWHVESMKRDAICNLRHELYLDLRQNISEIKRNFRTSYKSLITSGSRMWIIGVLDSSEKEGVWQEFRELHLKVSGRVTRSDETWSMQLHDIEQRRAFLIWLRNGSGEMVGGGLFSFTSDEGTYAVGAYNRSLFDKPLGHVVQYKAIEELRKRGVLWYKLGARFFRTEDPIPTDKEISISEFKQGFSSHFFPHYRMIHQVSEYVNLP